MPKYLTTQQYRDMDAGVLTSEVTDRQLANWIQNAEADIDAYMGFDLKVGGFEQHTTWVQSAWNEETLRTRVPNFPVPVINPVRYRIQVSNLSEAGAGFFANINAGDVSINAFEGYVEIVPLQAVTYSLSPVILQLGLKPPLVQLDCLVGFYFGVTGETLYNKGDNQTYYAQRGFWASTYQTALSIQPATLPPVPPVVYANGVVQASSTYTLNYSEGYVLFTTPWTAPLPTITLDYTYTIPDPVRQATVARTSWILGQRMLNKYGMKGIDLAMSGEQRIKRTVHSQFDDMIDPDTANKLAPYKQIALA